MNVLVIGGAGYIGSHVTLELLEQGHSVEVFDNLSSGVRENLFSGAGFTHGDILQKEQLVSCMENKGPFDCVIHLAAFKAAGESMIKPEKYSVNNITGTLNILNSMSETGTPRIVFSSSAAVYGEPRYLPIDEKHECDPENYYGFTKLEIERFLQWYSKLRDIRFAALRYFNAAGYDAKGRITGLEQNPANLLPVIMEVAVSKRPELSIFGNDFDTEDGYGVRDYVHVSDLARAHVSAMEYLDTQNSDIIVNLGSESGISVNQMLETARRLTGQSIPSKVADRRPGDPAKLVASSREAKKLLNWEARESDVESLVSSTWQVYTRHFAI
ncbi:UDP-glucose 4-epimerase GalE [Salinispira pacifica]|uniref:UDP-glucose 4-epimerase n=1 Tax=Salinispira pacifica TaxID=1307761 RepID=V5WES2_9SPIO|nr:UDP-glucose 4-epimerase GalE [Salinispira pacifica]AHC13666.1 UDP-glucose 4-epimerase [Salinispira pacifica]